MGFTKNLARSLGVFFVLCILVQTSNSEVGNDGGMQTHITETKEHPDMLHERFVRSPKRKHKSKGKRTGGGAHGPNRVDKFETTYSKSNVRKQVYSCSPPKCTPCLPAVPDKNGCSNGCLCPRGYLPAHMNGLNRDYAQRLEYIPREKPHRSYVPTLEYIPRQKPVRLYRPHRPEYYYPRRPIRDHRGMFDSLGDDDDVSANTQRFQ